MALRGSDTQQLLQALTINHSEIKKLLAFREVSVLITHKIKQAILM